MVFLRYLAKFQSVTNFRTRGFWTFISENFTTASNFPCCKSSLRISKNYVIFSKIPHGLKSYSAARKLKRSVMLTLRCGRHINKQSDATAFKSFAITEMAMEFQTKFKKDDFEFNIGVGKGYAVRVKSLLFLRSLFY